MIRTFIALEIPKEELLKVLQIRDDVVAPNSAARWETFEKLHITLKFLGDTEESNLEFIKNELLSISEYVHPLQISFSKFGVFKKGNDPNILWLGLEPSKELNMIVEKIENSFTKFGHPKETRRFDAHLTLLRFKGREDKNKVLKLIEAVVPKNTFECNTIHLFKSELKQNGSIYTSLHKFILNK